MGLRNLLLGPKGQALVRASGCLGPGLWTSFIPAGKVEKCECSSRSPASSWKGVLRAA